MSQRWSLGSLLALRCPQCGEDTFKAGFFKTAPACSACGQVFDRGSGFYAGAIYPFYGGAAAVGGFVWVFCSVLLGWSFEGGMAAAGVVVLLSSPWLFWYSRLSFIHTDHRFFHEDA